MSSQSPSSDNEAENETERALRLARQRAIGPAGNYGQPESAPPTTVYGITDDRVRAVNYGLGAMIGIPVTVHETIMHPENPLKPGSSNIIYSRRVSRTGDEADAVEVLATESELMEANGITALMIHEATAIKRGLADE